MLPVPSMPMKMMVRYRAFSVVGPISATKLIVKSAPTPTRNLVLSSVLFGRNALYLSYFHITGDHLIVGIAPSIIG